ncbi:F-box domain-containing protein [Mycena kentingensis (nom. inval.)]|nr:F-box domain-containing protein [Mycena kentingensis (nom. inval.)]
MHVQHLTTTNNPPLDSESQHISTLLVAARRDDAHIQNELAATRARERELVERSTELQHAIHTLAGVLSPVRRFPPEILAEVFVLAADDDENGPERIFGTTNARMPMALTRVCARWRMVARTTPQLWATLRISVCSSRLLAPQSIASLILYFTSLAGARGLSLDIELLSRVITGAPLAVLWSCASRIRALRIAAPFSALAPLAGMPAGTFGILEHLDLCIDEQREGGFVASIPAFHTAPLRYLKALSNARSDESALSRILSLRLRWELLRTVQLDFFAPESFGELWTGLAQCEMLEKLGLSWRSLEFMEDFNDPEVPLCLFPELTDLDLKLATADPRVPDLVLGHLAAPALRSLRVRMDCPSIECLTVLLQRSGNPALDSFHLEQSTVEPTALCQFLHSIPSITTLGLRRIGRMDYPWLHELEAADILPNLRILEMEVGRTGIELAEVLSLVETRRNLGLTQAKLLINQFAVARMGYGRLNELRDQGLLEWKVVPYENLAEEAERFWIEMGEGRVIGEDFDDSDDDDGW